MVVLFLAERVGKALPRIKTSLLEEIGHEKQIYSQNELFLFVLERIFLFFFSLRVRARAFYGNVRLLFEYAWP